MEKWMTGKPVAQKKKSDEPLSKVRMVDEMRGGSRRIADGNPAVAQGANDEPFQDSSGS
jgi:hypothetical protein